MSYALHKRKAFSAMAETTSPASAASAASPPRSPATKKRKHRQHSMTSKIKDAINTLEPKIKSRDLTKMIKSVCPSPAQCLVLSAEYIPHFHKLFSNFSDFSLLSSTQFRQFMNISAGANGFVNEIYYNDKTNTYTTSAIIKSGYTKTKGKIIENVTYEGLAGMFFINEEMYKFPCFIETYGICKYADNTQLKSMFSQNTDQNYTKIPPEFVNANLTPIFTPTLAHKMIKNGKSIKRTLYNSRAIKHAMNDSMNTAIVVQHIPDATDLHEYVVKLLTVKNKTAVMPHIKFGLNEELATLFFQVYSVLSNLADKFTHNDLHAGNALIYSLNEKYVKMVYHMPGDKRAVEFYTNKIMKLIDYGRCFVSGDSFSSKCFYKSICKMENMSPFSLDDPDVISTATPESTDLGCDEDEPTTMYETNGEICGKSYGLNSFWRTPASETDPYISTVKRNRSADLLLIHRLNSLLLNYIYKFEYTSPGHLPDIFSYLEMPMYTLLNEVNSVYRMPFIHKIINEYVAMLVLVQASLTKHNHPIIDKYNVKKSNLNELYLVYRSAEIVKFLHTHDKPVYDKFMHFNNSGEHYQQVANAFTEYKYLFDLYSRNSDNQSKTIMVLANLKLNYHLQKYNGYGIKEYEITRSLTTVNAVSFYLESFINETGILEKTREYFKTNSYNIQTSYEYIGELHVYLDGSGKNSHFVAE